jgi:hypothetical protein
LAGCSYRCHGFHLQPPVFSLPLSSLGHLSYVFVLQFSSFILFAPPPFFVDTRLPVSYNPAMASDPRP